MIIHAACPLLVPLRKPEYEVGVVNSQVARNERLDRSKVMMLPFRNRLGSVLLPPPLLYTDPFPLDDILDVSEIKTKTNQSLSSSKMNSL